jgi:hypothetical protein
MLSSIVFARKSSVMMIEDPNRRGRTVAARDFQSNGWLQPAQGLSKHLSMRKVARLAIILTMSGVCWLGVGCIVLMLQRLAGR